MSKKLPDGLVRYSESPIFDQSTVPQALQKNHKTKAGVWAKAVVMNGSLNYVLEGDPETRLTVHAGDYALIEPQVPHHVQVTGEVSFRLEFYRR